MAFDMEQPITNRSSTQFNHQGGFMKTAIIVMSDPKNGSEEALGRVFNALALAAECKQKGDEVAVVFNGTGTRWPAELTKLSHPANGLYNAVRDVVQGASCGCADVFGAKESVESCGIQLKKDHALAGTSGLLSLRRYVSEGWNTVVF
jgi:DsrE/DsrF-like family